MNTKRLVIGTKSKLFLEGSAFTLLDPGGTCGVAAKPDITDPAWMDPGPMKWTKSPDHKTELHMVASPGVYQAEDEIVLSVGLKLKAKLEKQSNFANQLALSTAKLPAPGTAGGTFNPLGGSPVQRAWLHIQEYGQNNVLLNTVEYWVAIKASGDTNNDDKAAETPIEATVLYSTLNVGNLT